MQLCCAAQLEAVRRPSYVPIRDSGATLGELVGLIAVTILFAVAGFGTMLVAETTLYNFAHAESFAFEPGTYNFRSARRPHVLRGSHDGHSVVITYGLFDYFSGGGESRISAIAYEVPEHSRVHFKMRSALPIAKRKIRTGDPAFDLWVAVEGGPKAFMASMLDDRARRGALKDIISPRISFTSTLTLTRAGPLVLRHKSAFLTRTKILRDLELLKGIADILEDFVSSDQDTQAAEQLAGALEVHQDRRTRPRRRDNVNVPWPGRSARNR